MATPAGLVWTASDGITFARLELLDAPGTEFHIFNVHLPIQGDPNHIVSAQILRIAVADMSNRISTPRLIPPIMMGDFNAYEPNIYDYSPTDLYDIRGRSDDFHDVIWIFSGRADAFPNSVADVAGSNSIVFPRVPTGTDHCQVPLLWTDHCSVFTTLHIRLRVPSQ